MTKPKLAEIPKITPISEEYKESALRVLNAAIKMVEEGEFHAVAIVMLDMDNKGIAYWSKLPNRNAALGQLAICSGRIVKQVIDED